jgi:hypothetical protein
MLHRQDYMLRLIEQMGSSLVELARRILNLDPTELPETAAELNALAHRVGMDLGLARRLDVESLHIMITAAGTVDPGRCWILAELLYLHGLQAERGQQLEAAQQSYGRSLHLYRQVEPEYTPLIELPAAAERLRELNERLLELGATPGRGPE